MSLLDSMPHECTIQKLVKSSGDLGGGRTVPAVEQTGVVCWEQSASASEIANYDKRGIRITRKVYFPVDPGITEQHQILITKRGGVAVSSPLVLDVRSEVEPGASAGMGILFRVMVDRATSEDKE